MPMTSTTNTPTTDDISAEYKRQHNLPGAVAIKSAIETGIDAHKKGEHACLKLVFAFYQGMVEVIDEKGTTLVSSNEAKRYCMPWNEGVTISDEMRKVAKEFDAEFIDGLCVEWSSKYLAATARCEELKGKKSSEAARNEFDENLALIKAVKAMVRRAIIAAYFVFISKPEKTNIDEKRGRLIMVLDDDRLDYTVTGLEHAAGEAFPSKAKPKGANGGQGSGNDGAEDDDDKGVTILNSIKHLKTFVEPRTFATMDSFMKQELQELYAVLTTIFAAKAEPVKAAKKSA